MTHQLISKQVNETVCPCGVKDEWTINGFYCAKCMKENGND
jgi:hypothetical protein